MKRFSGLLLALALLGLFSGPAFARDEVLISRPIDHGGYGGPWLIVAPVKNEAGLFLGGYGGWFINHCFLIGGGGYSLVSELKAPVLGPNGETLYFEMGYGGLVFEYVDKSHKMVHYTIKTLIGAGELVYNYKMSEGNWPFDHTNDSFFIIEPDINMELNVSTHFRAGLGVGYRYISGVQLEGITDEELSGLCANLTLKFGSF